MKLKQHLLRLIVLFIFILPKFIHGSYPVLNTLLDDIRLYKFIGDGTRFIHSGDLWEHSMWVYYASLELIDKKTDYAKDLHLSDAEKEIFFLATLLHDIGKAGRQELFDKTHLKLKYDVCKNEQKSVSKIVYTPDNQEHPLVGFEYLAQPFLEKGSRFKSRLYMLSSGCAFNFKKLFNELDINDEERKHIAILVGIHYEFGNFCSNRITCQGFLDKIQELVDAVSYNHNKITKKLLVESILIQVADVKGLAPVSYYPKTTLFPHPCEIQATHQKECVVPDPFKEFGYEPTPSKPEPFKLSKMRKMLAFWDSHFSSTLSSDQVKTAGSLTSFNISSIPGTA